MYAFLIPISLNTTTRIINHRKAKSSKNNSTQSQKKQNRHGSHIEYSNVWQSEALKNNNNASNKQVCQTQTILQQTPMISHLKSASKTQRSPMSPKSKSKSKSNKNNVNNNNNNNDNNNNNNNYSMWNCPSCTLLNDYTLLHCSLCSTPRPQPQLLSSFQSNYDSINQQS